MQYIKYFRNISKNKRLNTVLVFLLFLGTFYSLSVFAEEADKLIPVLASATKNFGTGSTFMKLFLGTDIVAAGYAWHKTKHPAALIGPAVLALFVAFAQQLWGLG